MLKLPCIILFCRLIKAALFAGKGKKIKGLNSGHFLPENDQTAELQRYAG